MTKYLIDPTAETSMATRTRRKRPRSANGLTVALLDISKARGDVFLDELGKRLVAAGLKVNHYKKPTFTRLAPVDLRQRISVECNLVIEALAD